MKHLIALLLILIHLGGCSLIYSYDSNITQRVKQWMKEENYITALETIKHIKPENPNYRTLQQNKREILQRLKKLEQQAIKDAKKLARQGEWLLALKRIDETAEKLVNKKNLAAYRVKLLKQREHVIQIYERKHLNAQARYLSSKIVFYEKIRKTIGNKEENKFNIVEFDKLCQQTSARLLEQAEHQYISNNYTKALSSINLALSLKPNKTTSSRLNRIKDLIHKLNKTRQLEHIVSAKSLLNSLAKGYSYTLLKEAKNKIDWLKKNKEKKNDYKDLISKLEQHLKTGTKHYFNSARKLYSIGEIQEALDIWLKLKEIVPDYPKLNSHIQRAKKILKKLKRLSNKKTDK